MTGEIINDSSFRSPCDVPDRPAGEAGAPEGLAAGSEVRRRKPRVRKPRPCFDDGGLTRVFKFPSKTYPRSSYYVTGDEIIIRIKKARKRWKLVIPKKRLVSYRTNRWFAKPRWVEIELTFTQAVRLGLVEPRAASGEDNTDAAAVLSGPAGTVPEAAVTPAAFESAATLHGGVEDASGEMSVELGDCDIEQELAPEADAEAEDAEEADGDGVAEVVVRADSEAEPTPDPVTDEELPAPEGLAMPEPAPAASPIALLPNDIRLIERPEASSEERLGDHVRLKDAAGVQCVRVARVERSAYAPLLAAGFALVLVGGAGSMFWSGLSVGDGEPVAMSQSAACGGGADARDCGQDFVTGSIAFAAERPAVEVIDPIAPASAMPDLPEVELPPDLGQRVVDAAKPLSVDGASAAANSEPSAPATIELRPDPREVSGQPNVSCQHAEAAVRSSRVQFHYASDRIEPALVLELIVLADRLKACPSLKVVLEGHTDSDGHPDRNQGLSLRRAETVLAVLVQSGVAAERMSAIGFGQQRPLVANDTAENRRVNRRVELSVSYDH